MDTIAGIDETCDPTARMLQSWDINAKAWTDAVRERRIASRRAGTDAAVVDAVLRARPSSLLDVGCGEGWLARALARQACRVVGIDASEPLIASARLLGGGIFEAMTYADFESRAEDLGAPFDVVACNFSLLDADLTPTLRSLRKALRREGHLVIQTVHPWIARRDGIYADGWRMETFADFGAAFIEPMPWYFRTLGSWIDAIGAAGFRIERIDEPMNAERGEPLSLLISAKARDGSEPR